jgi:hypothetical protein
MGEKEGDMDMKVFFFVVHAWENHKKEGLLCSCYCLYV